MIVYDCIPTCVLYYSSRPFVAFVYEVKEAWAVILAITTVTYNECCHFEKKKTSGIFTKTNVTENPLVCTNIQ